MNQHLIQANSVNVLELTRFDELELVVASGLKTFIEVGSALLEIQSGWKEFKSRAGHDTFEEYCRVRWHMSRQHAHRMIRAAKVVQNLSPTGDVLPVTESQARPLASLRPAQQREVWVEAVKSAANGEMTAAHVQQTKEQLIQKAVANSPADSGSAAPPVSDSEYIIRRFQTFAKEIAKQRDVSKKHVYECVFEYLNTP